MTYHHVAISNGYPIYISYKGNYTISMCIAQPCSVCVFDIVSACLAYCKIDNEVTVMSFSFGSWISWCLLVNVIYSAVNGNSNTDDNCTTLLMWWKMYIYLQRTRVCNGSLECDDINSSHFSMMRWPQKPVWFNNEFIASLLKMWPNLLDEKYIYSNLNHF